MIASHSSAPEKEKLATTACDGAEKISIIWISYCWCLLKAATQRKYFELNLNWGDVHLPAFAPCAALIPGLHEYTWIFKRMWYRFRGIRVHWKSVYNSIDLGCLVAVFVTKQPWSEMNFGIAFNYHNYNSSISFLRESRNHLNVLHPCATRTKDRPVSLILFTKMLSCKTNMIWSVAPHWQNDE